MAIRLSVEAYDPQLEGLLNYLNSTGLSMVPAKVRLLERAIAWVKLSDRFSYDAQQVEVVFGLGNLSHALSSQNTLAPQNQETSLCQAVEAQP
jgi:hypothetical protein